jgi:hypothetical protein
MDAPSAQRRRGVLTPAPFRRSRQRRLFVLWRDEDFRQGRDFCVSEIGRPGDAGIRAAILSRGAETPGFSR